MTYPLVLDLEVARACGCEQLGQLALHKELPERLQSGSEPLGAARDRRAANWWRDPQRWQEAKSKRHPSPRAALPARRAVYTVARDRRLTELLFIEPGVTNSGDDDLHSLTR